MLTLGAVILAFVFIPSALGVLWKETHNRKKLFLFISAFIGGICLIIGTMFKVQHWPGAGILLSLSALFGIFFFIPVLLASKLQDQENKAKRPVYILGAIGIICY
jgi:drug/metabolite transporter (DMT)-like permease